jgi:hypothetical protein
VTSDQRAADGSTSLTTGVAEVFERLSNADLDTIMAAAERSHDAVQMWCWLVAVVDDLRASRAELAAMRLDVIRLEASADAAIQAMTTMRAVVGAAVAAMRECGNNPEMFTAMDAAIHGRTLWVAAEKRNVIRVHDAMLALVALAAAPAGEVSE